MPYQRSSTTSAKPSDKNKKGAKQTNRRNRDRVNPQPFKAKGHKIKDGIHAIVPHAAALGVIAAKWSELERNLGLIYTYLLLGQETLAYDEYWTTRDFNKRKSKVLAAAAKKLPGDVLDKLRDLYEEIGYAVKFRNEIIHGQFSSCEEKPGAVLVWDIREVTDRVNLVFDGLVRIKRNPLKVPSVTVNLTPENYRLWNQRLFQGLIDWITELEMLASKLSHEVLGHSLRVWRESERQHE